MEDPGGLQSMGSLRVGHDWATSLSLFTFMHWRRKWQPTRVLAWRIPWTGEPGGLLSMGLHRVGHDWSDLAAAAACLTSSLLVVSSFIRSFTIHFLSTITVTNITLGAGHPKINNTYAVLRAAHRFYCRVESVMASWQVFQTLWQWFSTLWFNKIRLGAVSYSLVNLLDKNNFPWILLHQEKNYKTPRWEPELPIPMRNCLHVRFQPMSQHEWSTLEPKGTFILNPHSAILLQLLILLVYYLTPSVRHTPSSPGCKVRVGTEFPSCWYSIVPSHPQHLVQCFENDPANELQFMFMWKRRVREREREKGKKEKLKPLGIWSLSAS